MLALAISPLVLWVAGGLIVAGYQFHSVKYYLFGFVALVVGLRLLGWAIGQIVQSIRQKRQGAQPPLYVYVQQPYYGPSSPYVQPAPPPVTPALPAPIPAPQPQPSPPVEVIDEGASNPFDPLVRLTDQANATIAEMERKIRNEEADPEVAQQRIQAAVQMVNQWLQLELTKVQQKRYR